MFSDLLYYPFLASRENVSIFPLLCIIKPRCSYSHSGGVLKNRILAIFLPDSRKTHKNSIAAFFYVSRKKLI